jgi:hypothetical protein
MGLTGLVLVVAPPFGPAQAVGEVLAGLRDYDSAQ